MRGAGAWQGRGGPPPFAGRGPGTGVQRAGGARRRWGGRGVARCAGFPVRFGEGAGIVELNRGTRQTSTFGADRLKPHEGMDIVTRPRILVVGAGFAGVECVRRLERRLAPDEAELMLVTPMSYQLYLPLLPRSPPGS